MPNKHYFELHRKLELLRDEVFDEWETSVRTEVSPARQIARPILVDTLPIFYRRLVGLAAHVSRPAENSTMAEEHGGERARVTDFDAQSVVHEFQLFRETVFKVWDRHGIELKIAEIIAINVAVDEAIRESVTGFTAAEQRFREQFFAAFAHDLRTPLGVAKMAVDMIRALSPEDKIDQLAMMASKQHDTLTRMISDVLDSVVLDAGEGYVLELGPVDLLRTVEDAIRGASLTSGAEISLKAVPVQGNWCGQALRRAVENLLGNAVKYRVKNSIIQVCVEEFEGRALVIVQNEGPTIPRDKQDHLFDMFKRATRDNSGTIGWGIGLPYVRSVAERHGGSITLECNATTIRFVLDIPLDPHQVALKDGLTPIPPR